MAEYKIAGHSNLFNHVVISECVDFYFSNKEEIDGYLSSKKYNL
jgi:hypothetical protein